MGSWHPERYAAGVRDARIVTVRTHRVVDAGVVGRRRPPGEEEKPGPRLRLLVGDAARPARWGQSVKRDVAYSHVTRHAVSAST